MLFLDSKVLSYRTDANSRIQLLQELQERGLNPLIRSLRTRCFTDLLLGNEKVGEMETSIASWTESNLDEPFVAGDVFPFQDYLLYLIFDDDDPTHAWVTAGIVYET